MKLQTFLASVLLIILATLLLAAVLPEHHARTARVVFGVELLSALAFVFLIHKGHQWRAQKKKDAEMESMQWQSPQPEPAPPPGDTLPAKYGIGTGDDCDTVVRIAPDGTQTVIRPTVKPDADLQLEISEP